MDVAWNNIGSIIGIVLFWSLAVAAFLFMAFVAFTIFVLLRYGKYIEHVFLQRPLLIAETQPNRHDDDEIEFATTTGRILRGSYCKHTSDSERRAVIVFGHEYGGDRWLYETYLGPLLAHGYDVFAFDFACHGKSDRKPGYEPTQWITTFDVEDAAAALDYLAGRPDFEPYRVAVFGVSKGGAAMLAAAADRDYVRAVVLDGSFPNHGMIVEYEMKWVGIFASKRWLYRPLPRWFYGLLCEHTLWKVSRRLHVSYVRIERALIKYGARPLFAIRGGRDNYVTQPIFDGFLALADRRTLRQWTVDGAKHNLCVQVAGPEYHRRTREFLDGCFPIRTAPASQPAAT